MIRLKTETVNNINGEASKILAPSSGKIDKFEYLQVKKYHFQIKIKW